MADLNFTVAASEQTISFQLDTEALTFVATPQALTFTRADTQPLAFNWTALIAPEGKIKLSAGDTLDWLSSKLDTNALHIAADKLTINPNYLAAFADETTITWIAETQKFRVLDDIFAAATHLHDDRYSALSHTHTTSNAVTWNAVNKAGSSLADLERRSASDLTTGTLSFARFPTSGTWTLTDDLSISTAKTLYMKDKLGFGNQALRSTDEQFPLLVSHKFTNMDMEAGGYMLALPALWIDTHVSPTATYKFGSTVFGSTLKYVAASIAGYTAVGGSTNYNANAKIAGLSFGTFIELGAHGNANVELCGIDCFGIMQWGFTGITAARAAALYAKPMHLVNASASTTILTDLYGIYIAAADSSTAGGRTQTITRATSLYVEQQNVAGASNYQVVLTGYGTGTGIWFNNYTSTERIYANAAGQLTVSSPQVNLGNGTASRVNFTTAAESSGTFTALNTYLPIRVGGTLYYVRLYSRS